ncbi:MAG: hypothetical protein KBD78_12400 [Oligoflexales bacterium]|nr:hypothetical protein [Oligoflexales bacterium]
MTHDPILIFGYICVKRARTAQNFNRFNNAEKLVVFHHFNLRDLYYLDLASEFASINPREFCPSSVLVDNLYDALRHYSLAAYLGFHIGAEKAERMLTAHEFGANGDCLNEESTLMDLYNNKQGLIWAIHNRIGSFSDLFNKNLRTKFMDNSIGALLSIFEQSKKDDRMCGISVSLLHNHHLRLVQGDPLWPPFIGCVKNENTQLEFCSFNYLN